MRVSHSDRRQPAALAKALGTIIPLQRWLLAFSVLIVGLAASPASAQTCTVKQGPDFGTVTIADIVSKGGSLASTSAEIEYECKKDGHGDPEDYEICVAIDVLEPKQRVPNESHKFYLTQSDGSRIAWVADKSANASGGLLLPLVVTADNNASVSKGKMHLTVTYLDRQQQDLVRPGTYKNKYRLVSSTLPSRGVHSECPSRETIFASKDSSIIFTLETIVLPTCRLENHGQSAANFDPIDFGTIGALSAADAGAIRATTNIDVRCTYETPYTLDLDNGKNFDGGTRRMKNGDNFLAYQLFNKSASGESSPWSKLSGIGNTVNAVNKHTVEGQLTTPIAIAPAAGAYADTVVVTLTF
jgi:spore coat protein U-like protein